MGKIYKALEKSNHIEHDQKENKGNSGKRDDSVAKSKPYASHDDVIDKNREIIVKDSVKMNPELISPDLVTVLTPHSVASEQFRLLKNNILFPEKGKPPRSIMVTSASPNEGKSFVAGNLAASIAGSIDEYVLLIDCDLRSPTIQKLYGLPKGVEGLSEYLNEGRSLSSLLVKSFIDKLTILPAGNIPRNPSELLSSKQMRRMLQEVTTRYSDRYIIVDTPPPYLTSEASAIARQVDGIIMVIKHGKTRTKDVKDILDIYGTEKIIGVVQNFAVKQPGYGYGYYKYGYKYGYGDGK